MRILALLPLLLVAACGGKHVNTPAEVPVVVPQPVAVAVDAPCVPDTLKPAPDYADADDKLWAADVGPDVRYQLLWAGRAQRQARLNELEPIIEGCPRGKVK